MVIIRPIEQSPTNGHIPIPNAQTMQILSEARRRKQCQWVYLFVTYFNRKRNQVLLKITKIYFNSFKFK